MSKDKESKDKENKPAEFPIPAKGDSIEFSAIKDLLGKLQKSVNTMASRSNAIKEHFSNRPVDDKDTNQYIDRGINAINDLDTAATAVTDDLTQIRKEFPTTILSEGLILSKDPGSICADFITPLMSSEYVVGTVIDGVLENAKICIPQIGDMEDLSRMVDKLHVYIEHDLQETSIPRLIVNMITNVPGSPSTIQMTATQITDLQMCTDPTKIKVDKMELYLDPFHLEAIETMLLAIECGDTIKAP